MVLSSKQEPYDKFMRAQQETWDSIRCEGVDTLYFTEDGEEILEYASPYSLAKVLAVPCDGDYFNMHWKFRLALDYVKTNTGWSPYDFIFRTTASCYIDKSMLYQHAHTLRRGKLYSGWRLGFPNELIEHDGYTIPNVAVSGAGIWLSPDCCDILRRELKEGINIEEDILIGRILATYGIPLKKDMSRVDIADMEQEIIPSYHYRFKTGDREQDIKNMYKLHELICKR